MHNKARFLSILAAALVAVMPIAPAAAGGDDLGLVTWMGRLQYYVHKLGLAVSAQNRALQVYYAHEVEEVIEKVEAIEEADGVEIGKLVKVKLVPPFETLEGAVEAGDPGRIEAAYEGLLAGCNACHKASNRPYLHIVRSADNPYPQDFAFTPSP